MNDTNIIDPDNIRQKDMDRLADAIEEYIKFLEDIMIIPDDVAAKYGKSIKEGLVRTKKLIKKLRKGDISVFKDSDEWNSIR